MKYEIYFEFILNSLVFVRHLFSIKTHIFFGTLSKLKYIKKA